MSIYMPILLDRFLHAYANSLSGLLLPVLALSFTFRPMLRLPSGQVACQLIDGESPLFDDITVSVIL